MKQQNIEKSLNFKKNIWQQLKDGKLSLFAFLFFIFFDAYSFFNCYTFKWPIKIISLVMFIIFSLVWLIRAKNKKIVFSILLIFAILIWIALNSNCVLFINTF